MKAYWQSLQRSARVGLVVGVCTILVAAAGSAWLLFKTKYEVLFSDLKPQDAAVMTAELEKLKIPYKIDEGGSAILVDGAQVHATRIKVMGKDLPLHGALGFELFNNSDFGMTEFAQKINYQRALQGELTRTILSLSEIRDVRVHLALPEQGLFKQANAKPKAAITVTLHEGRTLRPEQVSGIQRLVAAATPGMTAQDVTVLDRQGVALSRMAEDGIDGFGVTAGHGNAGLELKKETEAQLLRKANAVLDKAFGSGHALASVDVTLNMDQIRTTTEDVLPGHSRNGDSKGVIIKERESIRDVNAPPLDAAKGGGASVGGSSQREVDYQVGRRVEQVTSATGAVRRIQVVAVVRQSLDAAQEEQLRRLLGAAVGAAPERGDTVVVQSLRGWVTDPQTSAPSVDSTLDASTTAAVGKVAVTRPNAVLSPMTVSVFALTICAAVLFAWLFRRRFRSDSGVHATALNQAEREVLLQRVKEWMRNTPPSKMDMRESSSGASL